MSNKNEGWFNQQGTITGWQAIGRNVVAFLVYAIGVGSAEALGDAALLVILPALVFYIWLLVATMTKRMKAFGFVGEWYNILFPNITDGTYPDRKDGDKV